MHRLALLAKMRSIVEAAERMLSAASPAMRGWRLAWGHTKRNAVSLSYPLKLVYVSRHFLPLVPTEELELIAYHIFRVCGRITRWPFDTDCAARIREKYVLAKTVVHECKCGLLAKKTHVVDTIFAERLCPQCNWAPVVFRQPPTVPGWRPVWCPT